jgi:alpha-ketoglutarate-dependent taurine dioxygenase
MVVTIEPLDTTLGAVVKGVRLADLDDATWERLEAAFTEHALLLFRDQHLSEQQQTAFGRRFGEIENLGGGTVSAISNRRRDGTMMEPDEPVMMVIRGNEGWHTDSSYMQVSAKASMLSAHEVPGTGGTTQWADMRAAYDALDDRTRGLVDRLTAYHSIAYSQARIGQTDPMTGFYGFDAGPAPLRPLVKVHPVTGRRALFIGRHAHAIPGMDAEESERFLDGLVDDACRSPRIYEHEWRVGDLAVWDNRCVLHRARPWDLQQVRVMKHTRIKGDPVTEAALAPTVHT